MWKDIDMPGVSRGYLASEEGLIKREDGFEPRLTPSGRYLSVSLRDENGVYRKRSVHRVVAWTFLGPPTPDKPLVLHGDGNPHNNQASNLRWGDYSENSEDSVKHGTHRNVQKSSCPRGHPYRGQDHRGYRTCSICERDRATRGLPPEDPRHGKRAGYIMGCRCESCTRANSEYQRARPANGLPPRDERHGTLNGYGNFKCRCDECRRAKTSYTRAWRTAK